MWCQNDVERDFNVFDYVRIYIFSGGYFRVHASFNFISISIIDLVKSVLPLFVNIVSLFYA